MDIIYKVIIGIIALPFLLSGISFLMQLAFGSGVGLLTLFSSIWDKNVKMTAKEGVITGVIYVVAQVFLLIVFGFLTSFTGVGYKFTIGLNNFLSFLPLPVLFISLIRCKIAYGCSFFVITQLLTVLVRLL